MNRPSADTRTRASAVVALLVSAITTAHADAPLAEAIHQQNTSRIESLLREKSDVNAAEADGMTPLHWAVHLDQPELVNRLLAAGADVKAASRYDVTPLSLACTNGNAGIVAALLDAGADPNASLRGGETALMTAARTGKVEAVRALLDKGASVNARERTGQSALMWAADEGHADVVQLLIDRGADYRIRLKSDFTPLHFAARDGRTAVVETLLKAGADINDVIVSRKASGKSPDSGTSPLILAVENGHFELALVLVRAGADPNDQRSGFTPLHTLTWVRKPNRGDGDDGEPPPQVTGALTSLEFARQLIALGANVNARLERGAGGKGHLNKKGATPFLMAASTADVPYMRVLVESGADPLASNVDHCTPLHAAAGVGTLAPGETAGTEPEAIEAVKLAIQLGGDVNAVDDNGETPMHGAAYKSFPKVVQLLADNGAKVDVWNQKNKHGWTPLLIAQGYRPGNFKPAPETIAAIERLLN
jgi:uncharacterized protein